MYGELNLKAISKTFKETEKTSNFLEFWSEQLHHGKKIKPLMFEHYYFMIPLNEL
jgi:hypothetical protein